MPVVKPSPRILHSSPVEAKKLGFPFSENEPSAIQGEGATSPFSDLREWEERGVTTPNIQPNPTQPNQPINHPCIKFYPFMEDAASELAVVPEEINST
jgi:hypothetical protein